MTPPDVTIVVPTYNERDRLEELVMTVFDAASRDGLALEVIVVDDASPDGTGALADALARRFRLSVVHRPGKLGLGTAVLAGFDAASAEVVGVMDADLSHPPALLPALFRVLQRTGTDMVVASRYVPGGSTPDWPLARRILSRFGCLLARPLSPVRDATSGFFLIRRGVTRDVALRASGFKIALELIVRAHPASIIEVPYRFEDRKQGESKMSTREGLGYLVQLKNLYWLKLTQRRAGPQRSRRLTVSELDATRAGSPDG